MEIDFSQKIDMRGYGTTNGHQNIVITVDGVRLNNHTSSSQSIGNIILNNIDRIEITKRLAVQLFMAMVQ